MIKQTVYLMIQWPTTDSCYAVHTFARLQLDILQQNPFAPLDRSFRYICKLQVILM